MLVEAVWGGWKGGRGLTDGEESVACGDELKDWAVLLGSMSVKVRRLMFVGRRDDLRVADELM